jgi:hypothetical protein
MRLHRLVLAGSLVAIISACDRSPTAPEGALIGSWGGDGARLVAKAASVRVQLSCGFSIASQPLIPDADGRFEMSIPPWHDDPTADNTLRGTVDGAAINFELITITADATHTFEFTVVRGQSPTFGVCAALSGNR